MRGVFTKPHISRLKQRWSGKNSIIIYNVKITNDAGYCYLHAKENYATYSPNDLPKRKYIEASMIRSRTSLQLYDIH